MHALVARPAGLLALLVAWVTSAIAAVPPPLPHAMGRPRPHPAQAAAATLFRGPPGTASPWQSLATTPPFEPGAMLLLTDGTVIVQDQGPDQNGTGNWWRLTPDSFGSYVNGTWSQIASLPTGYAPLYFASAILPDGRVIIEGGEYNSGKEVWTNKGAIYDPLTNSWTAVKHPKGNEWVRIGDGPGTVLANGKFMLGASGYSGSTSEALLNAATLKWKATGAGKADGNGEEGWSLLPNGDLLTVDTTNGSNTEIYNPKTGAWASAGSTPVALIDPIGGSRPANPAARRHGIRGRRHRRQRGLRHPHRHLVRRAELPHDRRRTVRFRRRPGRGATQRTSAGERQSRRLSDANTFLAVRRHPSDAGRRSAQRRQPVVVLRLHDGAADRAGAIQRPQRRHRGIQRHRIPESELEADHNDSADNAGARRQLHRYGQATRRSDAGFGLRRRLPECHELPAGAHYHDGHRACFLRPHRRHDGNERKTESKFIGEFHRPGRDRNGRGDAGGCG
ncbi:MAG: hypothetical protein WDN04_04760 [Rhodospirillales bacterium]